MKERSRAPRGAVTADRLVAAAAKLFREQGFAATTTRQLSSELGIQRASLYHHIASKEDLLYEISSRSLDRIKEAVGDAVATGPADKRLNSLIAAHLKTALRDQDLHATMLIELKHLSPVRRATIVEKRDEYEDLVRGVITVSQEAGDLRTDLTSRELSLSLLNLLNWTIFWYDPSGRESPQQLAETFSAIFIDGARQNSRPS